MEKQVNWFIGLLGVLLIAAAPPLFAQSVLWEEMPGNARDIAIGGSGAANDDVIYMIGKQDIISAYGGWVYRWDENESDWKSMPGLAVAVSVSPLGVPWVVNGEGKIFEWSQNRFIERPGYSQSMRARDIGIGNSGIVMIINKSDGHIYYWNGTKWIRKCKFYWNAIRIDVDYSGNPWLVNSNYNVYQYLNGSWNNMSSGEQDFHAWDIGADLNGWEAWATRQDQFNSAEGGPPYYIITGSSDKYWYGPIDPENATKGTRIDLSDGVIWMTTATGKVWRGIMN